MILVGAVSLIILYFFPGYIFSRFFKGSGLLWRVFLSFLVVPFEYEFLAFLNQVNLPAFAALNVILFGVTRIKKIEKIDLNKVFLPASFQDSKLKVLTLAVLALFFILLMLPRFGLITGNVPVGDDKPRVGQVTSIALSPTFPLHF